MKVLWLGAGASVAAGYPTSAAIMDELEKIGTTRTTERSIASAWDSFARYRESSSGNERTILNSPNPEVIFSLPDLLSAALDADDVEIERDLAAVVSQFRSGVTETSLQRASVRLQSRYCDPKREPLQAARKAQRDLLAVLDFYFACRHHEDSLPANRSRRDTIRRELSKLSSGDVVVTTNWDTTVERTLLGDGRWTPSDGYGFPVHLVDGLRAEALRQLTPPPAWIATASDVVVLKLHGSFGWRSSYVPGSEAFEDGHVRLDYPLFLREIPVTTNRGLAILRDHRTPFDYDPAERPLYVLPSYMKRLGGASIQAVWNAASVALARADAIHLIGASLPDADTAVRAILNTARFRAAEGTMNISVSNPDLAALQRAQQFFGGHATLFSRRAGE